MASSSAYVNACLSAPCWHALRRASSSLMNFLCTPFAGSFSCHAKAVTCSLPLLLHLSQDQLPAPSFLAGLRGAVLTRRHAAPVQGAGIMQEARGTHRGAGRACMLAITTPGPNCTLLLPRLATSQPMEYHGSLPLLCVTLCTWPSLHRSPPTLASAFSLHPPPLHPRLLTPPVHPRASLLPLPALCSAAAVPTQPWGPAPRVPSSPLTC